TSIPLEITNLKNLEILSLIDNPITFIPKEIFQMKCTLKLPKGVKIEQSLKSFDECKRNYTHNMKSIKNLEELFDKDSKAQDLLPVSFWKQFFLDHHLEGTVDETSFVKCVNRFKALTLIDSFNYQDSGKLCKNCHTKPILVNQVKIEDAEFCCFCLLLL